MIDLMIYVDGMDVSEENVDCVRYLYEFLVDSIETMETIVQLVYSMLYRMNDVEHVENLHSTD
jgi:hypothetical protein